MSLIPNLSDIPDLGPVEEGEYDLRIIKAQPTKSKRTGRNGTLLICDVVGEDNAENVMHTIWHGNSGDYQKDDDAKSQQMWRMAKEFLTALGLDTEDELSEEDFKDLEFTAELRFNDGMSTDEDGSPVKVGPPRNEIGNIL